MKVILLKDISGVGRRFEVKDVPNGYAHNFLLPRKMAELATPGALRKLEKMNEKTAEKSVLEQQEFADALKSIAKKKIELKVPANVKGKLFESVKAEDIADKFAEEGIQISPEHIALATQIKEVGEHAVTLRSGDMEQTFTLHVSAQT